MKNIVNYAELVKERHALNETIAPVEVDQTDASRAYAVGDQLIYDSILYDVIDDIAQHGIITAEGAGANIRTADTIVEQIKNKTFTTDPVPTEGSTNPVQSNGVYVDNRNIYEVMGKMGTKALLPMSLADIKARHSAGTWNGNAYTINGITYTINTDSDGFITDIVVTGTASADATLTVYGYSYTSAYAKVFDVPVIASTDFVGSNSTARGIIWGSNSGYIDDTELQIAAGTIYGFGLRVVNGYEIPEGGITFKPMLRFASDTDSTYQPYVKTNKELTAENEALTNNVDILIENGAVNSCVFETWNSNSSNVRSQNGVTGTIANGTVIFDTGGSASTGTIYWQTTKFTLKKGTYKFRVKGATNSGFTTIKLIKYSDSSEIISLTSTDEGIFTLSSDTEIAIMFVDNVGGKIFNNVSLTPMITAPNYNGTDVPYAKTNRELTAENQTLTNQLGDITQLNTTDKSSAVAAINEVNAALGNKASTTDVDNKHKLTIETVSTSGWTADSTSQSGTTLYKKSISLNHVYVESPAVDIATSSGTGLPTAAEQTAYDLLQYVTVDGTTLYLYASAIPSTQFYIGVEGVD